MTKQYRLRPDGFKEVRNQIIVKTVCIALSAIAMGFAISVYDSDSDGSKMDVLPFVIIILVAALAYGLRKGINRQRILFESLTISISESEITSEQADRAAVSIPFNQIKSIVKYGNGSLGIKGDSSLNMIIIPAKIENYEQLASSLNDMGPFKQVQGTAYGQVWVVAAILLTMTSMGTFFISTHKVVVGISGTLLIGLFIWSFVVTQKSKMVDNRAKRGSYLTLFLILVFIVIMVRKLAGN